MSTSLDGRVAFVTGAGGAIGAATVAALAAAGATVVAADAPGVPIGGADLASRVALDITDADAAMRVIGQVVAEHGRIDIAVNVAAIYGEFRHAHRISVESWDRYMEVNLSGTFHVVRAVLPPMIAAGFGRIINVSSISSARGGHKQVHYAASKAAVEGLTRSVALEYASSGITCNAVQPGPMDTARSRATPPDIADAVRSVIPARRFGAVDEVAATIVFLAGDGAGYVNGACIPVDGAASTLQMTFGRRAP